MRGTATTLKVAKAAAKTKLTGVLKAGAKGVSGKALKVYAQKKGKKWIKVANDQDRQGRQVRAEAERHHQAEVPRDVPRQRRA